MTTVQQSIFGAMQSSSPCPDCKGVGTVIDKPCSHCHGDGRVRTHERLDVEVPAGVGTGRQLRLRGYGEAGFRGAGAGDLIVTIQVEADEGFRGAGAGDLIVTIQVEADERFERHGDDLLSAATSS